MGLNNGGSITKKTCADEGHWLGNTSAPYFTIIDTPGFGNNLVSNESRIIPPLFMNHESFHLLLLIIPECQNFGSNTS